MKIYLISNNSLMDDLSFERVDDLEFIRKIRPLSAIGEENAKRISELNVLKDIEKIYSSFYSSALSTAKYLAKKMDLEIFMNNKFDDCKVGILGNKNMKMVKGMQDHDFNYKLSNGESLIEVSERVNSEINKILTQNENIAIFTHKRTILGFLLKYCQVGYNLDDSLILEYKDKQVYDDSDNEFEIYELTFKNNDLIDINII